MTMDKYCSVSAVKRKRIVKEGYAKKHETEKLRVNERNVELFRIKTQRM